MKSARADGKGFWLSRFLLLNEWDKRPATQPQPIDSEAPKGYGKLAVDFSKRKWYTKR